MTYSDEGQELFNKTMDTLLVALLALAEFAPVLSATMLGIIAMAQEEQWDDIDAIAGMVEEKCKELVAKEEAKKDIARAILCGG